MSLTDEDKEWINERLEATETRLLRGFVRNLRKEGAFKRDVVERKEESIRYDTATLSCGHTAILPAWDTIRQWDCHDCMEAALKLPAGVAGGNAV